MARGLGLRKDAGPIWSVRTEGILAIDRTLTVSKPCLVRIISIGGPSVSSPVHLKAMAGYPIQAILDKYVFESGIRVLNGGILTGEPVSPEMSGLDGESQALTVIPELKAREFLGFTRPGWDRRSYSKCFLSAFRKDFSERLTTAMRGELRPCISCNFCEELCPAGIMPHLIHKYLYYDLLEEANEARADLCVRCGLCSYVCPSKIELVKELAEVQERIRQELQPEPIEEKG